MKNIFLFIGIVISLFISFLIIGFTASNGFIFKSVFHCVLVMISIAIIISFPFWVYQEQNEG